MRLSYPVAKEASFDWQLPSELNMAAQCLAHPSEQVALKDLSGAEPAEVTYGELAVLTETLAAHLRQVVRPGDRVGVLRSQDPWCAAAHLAIWKIGAISVPLFKLFKSEGLSVRVNDAGMRLCITDVSSAPMLEQLSVEPILPEALPCSSAPTGFAATGPEDPAVLIYTSGTTGTPKGALHGHRVLTGHLPGVAISHDHLGQPGDCLWTPADWAWIGGLFDVLMPGLALGVPVVAARFDKFSAHAVRLSYPQGRCAMCFSHRPPCAC